MLRVVALTAHPVYLIRCDGKYGSQNTCYLSFPYGNSLIVEMTYLRKYLVNSVAMADKVALALKRFEVQGREMLMDTHAKNN